MAKNDKTLNNVELKQMVTDIILELSKSDSYSKEAKEFIANDKFRQEAYGTLRDYMAEAISSEMNKLREENRRDMADCIRICKNMNKRVYKMENKIYNLKRDMQDFKEDFEDFKIRLGGNLDRAFSSVEKRMDSLKQSIKKLKEFVKLMGVDYHLTDFSDSFNKTIKNFKKAASRKKNRYDNN